MHQDRITESSNMLHYSNASSREKNRRYLVIKGGGACLVALARRMCRQHRSRPGGTGIGLGVYRKEVTEGQHNK